MEKIRVAGRDVKENLSKESKRKFFNELVDDRKDTFNLLLKLKEDLDIYRFKDGIEAKEVEDLEEVVKDVVKLRDILVGNEYGLKSLENFSHVRFLRIIFVVFGFVLKCKL